MDKKSKMMYLILGLGIGIVITSALYSFNPVIKYNELSDEMIIEKSKELGMISLKESINTTPTIKEEVIEKEEPIEEPVEEIPKETEIEVIIKSGENLTQIGRKLFDLGLIDSKEEFIQLAKDKKMSTKFIVGTYKIKINTSYTTIIDILTKGNEEK